MVANEFNGYFLMISRLMTMIYASLRISFNFSSFLINFSFSLTISSILRKKMPSFLNFKASIFKLFFSPTESEIRKNRFLLTPTNLQSTNLVFFFFFLWSTRQASRNYSLFLGNFTVSIKICYQNIHFFCLMLTSKRS